MLDYQTINSTGQKFHLKGTNPTLLIVSGIHGDEAETVPLVEKAVEKYYDRLPDFLYIPAASPSALKLGTRKNGDGVDMNRSFKSDTTIPEVRVLMNLWSQYSFELFLEIHEDPELSEFYLYDGETDENMAGRNLVGTKKLEKLFGDIQGFGVKLFDGIDDPDDPDLGYEVKNGYSRWPMVHNDHGAESWLIIDEHRLKQVINPEIPGIISTDKKAEIIDAVFRRLILKDLS